MAIVVQGYSGCLVRVRPAVAGDEREAGCSHVLEKAAGSVAASGRLHKQIDKQDHYRERLVSRAAVPGEPEIAVPRILFRRDDPSEGLTVGMVFENHTDCLTFMATAPVADIRSFVAAIVRVIALHVELSPIAPVPSDKISSKLADVLRVCRNNAHLEAILAPLENMLGRLSAWIDAADEHFMPLGLCHGDLTLSNVLVQRRGRFGSPLAGHPAPQLRIVLIDFLDSFVETPLADMAKLCQDVVYGWTLRMAPSTAGLDKTRIFLVYDRLERALHEAFGAEAWFKRYFRFFFVVNQLRVLQYSVNTSDRDYLFHSAQQQFELWAAEAEGAAA